MKSEALKKLNIIFIAKETPNGHTSDCMGLAKLLTEKGHRVVVVVSRKGQVLNKEPDNLEKSDDEGESNSSSTSEQPATNDHAKQKEQVEIVEFDKEPVMEVVRVKMDVLEQLDDVFALNPRVIKEWFSLLNELIQDLKKSYFDISDRNIQLENLVKKYDPDIFVTDGLLDYNTINRSDKPWVWLFSGNPLRIINDSRLPPPYLGLPADTTNSNVLVKVQTSVVKSITSQFYKLYNVSRQFLNFVLKTGKQPFKVINEGSPYLNIYAYPKELDYPNSAEWTLNCYRVDSFLLKRRMIKEALAIPEEKKPKFNLGKKTVLISLGQVHKANINFMNTLLKNLSDSPHNFLISKDMSTDYHMSENMVYFDPTLTQNQLIQVSDAVITDGNDDTILSAFSLGKPMIVIPYWLAQLDNAQRLHETGYGIRLSPWSYSKKDILGAIEIMLNDWRLKEKLRSASHRILRENRLHKAVELIENLGVDKNFYQVK